MHKHFQLLLVFTSLLTLAGCAGLSADIPEATGTGKAAVAISLKIDSRTTFTTTEQIDPQMVLFVKLDSRDDSLKKERFLASNFTKGSFMASLQFGATDVYLLDIEPGVYAAVGMIGKGANTRKTVYVYFPEELIRGSIVEVGADTMGYMGRYKLATVTGMGQMHTPDEAQEFYYSIDLFGGRDRNLEKAPRIARQYLGGQHHSPELKSAENGREVEKEFLDSRWDVFQHTSWADRIENRLRVL